MRYREDIETRFTARQNACIRFSGDMQSKMILDVGCWIGWYEKFIAQKGCEFIVGIDLDFKALKKAKASNRLAKVDFVLASSLALPFRYSSMDNVSMFDIIEHLPGKSETTALSEANSVLKEQGTLLISTPNDKAVAKILDPAHLVMNHKHYSADWMKDALEKTGFKVTAVRFAGGIVELLSMILVYVFKHIFNMEIPLKGYLERLREKEYSVSGFATMFVKATKSGNMLGADQ